ncbi:MltF family protein [Pseudohaliea rubra]|uniref:Transglycosylase, Slt family n=1 Tax=Pseudohaliea rubra DSM 19751 TaxID=1265313 RepID=A0A095XUB9_9GAMM|nr:lytic transglycosylase F [Pseudohaliea rubra]KGE03286.1 Transglycosylase, Slt family [Pseudohaliea rubra DSM 19751]
MLTLLPRRALQLLFLAFALTACGAEAPPDDGPVALADSTATGKGLAAASADEARAALDSSDLDDSNLDDSDAPDSSALAFTRPWLGDLDGMEERRLVRVLTVYGPGRFYLDAGRGAGLVAELAERFEDHLNDQLDRGHLRVNTVIIPVARNELVPALLAGRGDIIAAGLTITDARAEELEFSIPTSKALNEILVTGPGAPPVAGVEDLSGRTVYLRLTSSYAESVRQLNERLASAGKAPVKIEPMPESLEDDDLIEMVNAGLLPWAIVDEYKVQLWEGVFTDLTPRPDITFRNAGRLAWAMRKDSPLLKASVDAFLRSNREGTLIGNVLRNRYVRDFDWAANALGDADYARFEALEGIFRRYGERYGIEHLMAAAQGYQESRLDQSVRSHAGAIGIMQVLPTTAADPNVDIPDISSEESNIHAGIKYMDFLRSRYFDDPAISDLDKLLLSLAAYNAGPARVRSLRRTAGAEGYDPNVWFDNVEVIAAREIGRETVQYVTNIYRYYLTYRMVASQALTRRAARQDAGLQ